MYFPHDGSFADHQPDTILNLLDGNGKPETPFAGVNEEV
jgi:hypothetical protein